MRADDKPLRLQDRIGSATIGFNARGSTPPTDALFAGGTIVAGGVSSYFVDPATNTLQVLTDIQKIGHAEITNLMPTAVGFDARFGYDVDGDGVLDAPLLTAQNASAPFALRSVRVGLVATRATDGVTRDAPWFGGVIGGDSGVRARPGEMVLSLEGTALMRANGLFQ